MRHAVNVLQIYANSGVRFKIWRRKTNWFQAINFMQRKNYSCKKLLSFPIKQKGKMRKLGFNQQTAVSRNPVSELCFLSYREWKGQFHATRFFTLHETNCLRSVSSIWALSASTICGSDRTSLYQGLRTLGFRDRALGLRTVSGTGRRDCGHWVSGTGRRDWSCWMTRS
jgi:hypothetical protein